MTLSASTRVESPVLPSHSLTAHVPTTERLCVDGICFDNIPGTTALAIVRHYLDEGASPHPRTVFFVNVHSVHLARRDADLREALHKADLVLPDGSGLALAGKVTNRPVWENLNGTDFIPRVLGELAGSGRSVYLLGAHPPVLEKCVQNLAIRFPGLVIAGFRHGHFSESEAGEVIRAINDASPDVLLVGMGTPTQETWIASHRSELRAKTCFGVGGLFDFLSGEKPRAPRWVRDFGLEWAYRFAREPKSKWDRALLEIPLFVARTFIGRVSVTSHPVRSHKVVESFMKAEE